MNLVVVRHFETNTGCKFLFKLPDGVFVDAGDYVVCHTKKGESIGQCCTPNFEADPEVVSKLWGGNKEIKPVMSVLRPHVMVYSKKSVEELMQDGIQHMINLSATVNANMVKPKEAHYGAYEKD